MKRRRVLILGAGDVALRAARRLGRRVDFVALVRHNEEAARWRAVGARVIFGDLDEWRSLQRLPGSVDQFWMLAPPAAENEEDRRGRWVQAALRRAAARAMGRREVRGSSEGERNRPRGVYVGTVGIYGDRGGEWVRESDRWQPMNDRARRRAEAERQWRDWSRRGGWVVRIRVPGIYAVDRLPVERLRQRLPAIVAEEDSFSNHIHADDLARLLWWAGWRGQNGRAYHACDDFPLPIGDWFDAVADFTGLPRPPRLPRAAALAAVGAVRASFLAESRRLDNSRLRSELRFRLCFPTVAMFFAKTQKERSERDG
ncbi:MAG: SDR family NAD(P)-dependent oxidoreductase [Hydrogenophilus sp.]|nr:SDR family NAD(P)-dependent oxidoreductase [Hydrogenophilus sp.]